MKLPLAEGRHRKPAEMLGKIFGFSALAIWFFSFYVFYQYDATRPVVANVSVGRVYPQNNHGHYVYLTGEEARHIESLRVLAFVLLGLTFTTALYVRDPLKRKAPWEKKRW